MMVDLCLIRATLMYIIGTENANPVEKAQLARALNYPMERLNQMADQLCKEGFLVKLPRGDEVVQYHITTLGNQLRSFLNQYLSQKYHQNYENVLKAEDIHEALDIASQNMCNLPFRIWLEAILLKIRYKR